jgi:hypothetical protein
MLVAWGLLAAVLLVVLLLKPALLLFPLVVVLYCILVAVIYFNVGVQNSIDDTYRIPGTQIVLRTTFNPWAALGTAPYLEVRNGHSPPLKICLAGPSPTRAQLYSVEGGGIVLETARDTFWIKTAPFSVEGPPHWMRLYALPTDEYGTCDYDARSDAPMRERIALKAGLKLAYIGAFDQVSDRSWYRRFWPPSLSPEQKITP